MNLKPCWHNYQSFFFGVLSPIPNGILVLSPQFWKKSQASKYLFEGWDFNSVITHASYMLTIFYHCILFLLTCLMTKVCVLINSFLLTKKDIIKHYTKVPN